MMTKIRAFRFDVIIRLPEACVDGEELLDGLYLMGCDDAVIGTGTPGFLGLGFSREGVGRDDVIAEAVEQALAGLPGGSVVHQVRYL